MTAAAITATDPAKAAARRRFRIFFPSSMAASTGA
jgi:hypothetical protein